MSTDIRRRQTRKIPSWAFNKNAWTQEPNEEWCKALDWMKRNSLPVSALAEADVLRRALDAMCRKLDGNPAAAKTARRKRAAFSEVLNTAVEKGYFAENPLNGLRWNAPAVNEEVDPAAVPNPAQVARLLAAVAQQRGRGPHLEAFYGCIYYAAMRPAEVIHLRLHQCHLPDTGWGMLNLSGGVVTAGKEWTDDGAVHEVHSLKRRAPTATRPVPIPPRFVRMLRAHIERFGVAPDGRLFPRQPGPGTRRLSRVLVRDWSGSAGQERYSRGRNWELQNQPGPALNRSSGRRLTGKRPGQTPFSVLLEEAQLLR